MTYTLRIYDEDNILVRTEPNLTGTSYTYTEANERSDCGLGPTDPLNTQLRFELWSVRDGYDSWQRYDLTLPRKVMLSGQITAQSSLTGSLSIKLPLSGSVAYKAVLAAILP